MGGSCHKVRECKTHVRFIDTLLDFALQSAGHLAVLCKGTLILEDHQCLEEMPLPARFNSPTHGVVAQGPHRIVVMIKTVPGTVFGAILWTVRGTVFGAVIGTVFGAILWTVRGTVFGAVIGTVFGAVIGAILAPNNCTLTATQLGTVISTFPAQYDCTFTATVLGTILSAVMKTVPGTVFGAISGTVTLACQQHLKHLTQIVPCKQQVDTTRLHMAVCPLVRTASALRRG